MTNSCIDVALLLLHRHEGEVRLTFRSRDVVSYFRADFSSLSDAPRSVPEQFPESILRRRSRAADWCGLEVWEHS